VLCGLWFWGKWRPERRLQMRFARVVGPARTHAGFCVREHDSVEKWITTPGAVILSMSCQRCTSLAGPGAGSDGSKSGRRVSRSTTSMMPEHAGQRRLGRSVDLRMPLRRAERGSVRARHFVCGWRRVRSAGYEPGRRAEHAAGSGAGTRGGNGHKLFLAAVCIVSPAEGDTVVFKSHEPMVGDGHAMCVAGQVVEDVLRPAERRLGVRPPSPCG